MTIGNPEAFRSQGKWHRAADLALQLHLVRKIGGRDQRRQGNSVKTGRALNRARTRQIDGKRCWYKGKAGMDKKLLRWAENAKAPAPA